ncbi:MAG: universal stress protein [Dehalococcoidales bacterium]
MYKKIMVPLDGSELAECVLPHVEAIAKGCKAGDVIFLRVVEPFYPRGGSGYIYNEEDVKRIESKNKAAAEKYLDQLVSRGNYGSVNVQSEIITGKAVADSIADYATKNEVDLIVIATHGRSGVSRWVWGSVADRILRSACVPVLMVRAPGCIPGI